MPPAEELPTFEQFEYWYLKGCDLSQKLISREGQRAYNLRHRVKLGDSTQKAFGPGSIFQIDSTIADIYLVHSKNRNWIVGRPTLYLVRDLFSRVITGFAVTLEPASWLGAMLALENVTTNKVDFCKGYSIEINESEWPSHHLPDAIVADRAEFEGYNADNLVNSPLNISICNTPPYRADLKGVIERSFRWFNDIEIHWLPGAVKKTPERGDRDCRLDSVLTPYEFRQLMILCILYHNNENRLDNYRMNEFMIQDDLEPYPNKLWEWGIENCVGILHWKPTEVVRLNLLPSAQGSVTREGIYFKRLHYSCDLAEYEQWFLEARTKRSWSIDICYDPRTVDYVYLRLDKGRRMVVCHLLEVDRRFQGMDFREVAEYFKQKNLNKQAAASREIQAKAIRHAHVNQIVSTAKELAQASQNNQSQKSRIEDIQSHRNDQRTCERKEEAWRPQRDDSNLEKVDSPQKHEQLKDTDEIYIPPPKEIELLTDLEAVCKEG